MTTDTAALFAEAQEAAEAAHTAQLTARLAGGAAAERSVAAEWTLDHTPHVALRLRGSEVAVSRLRLVVNHAADPEPDCPPFWYEGKVYARSVNKTGDVSSRPADWYYLPSDVAERLAHVLMADRIAALAGDA